MGAVSRIVAALTVFNDGDRIHAALVLILQRTDYQLVSLSDGECRDFFSA